MAVDGTEIRIPSGSDLIRNKRTSGRTKELAEAEVLEKLKAPNHH